jgi:hypothetical protein
MRVDAYDWGDAEAGLLHRRWVAKQEAAARRANREDSRVQSARRFGYKPPPPEKDCPPRPDDGRCQCCDRLVKGRKGFHLDHCHETGAFRGWICGPCNTGVGIADDIERLEKRAAFLRAHEKKIERVALIRATHLRPVSKAY